MPMSQWQATVVWHLWEGWYLNFHRLALEAQICFMGRSNGSQEDQPSYMQVKLSDISEV